MCVIVSNPRNSTLERDRLSRLWDRNRDGGGFAYIDSDLRIQVTKSMDKEEFMHKYFSARGRHKDAHFLLHMRIATHGSVNLDNVHPFRVDEHTVMAHNGVIDIESFAAEIEYENLCNAAEEAVGGDIGKAQYPDWKKDPWDRSDTRIFVEEMLPELPENWLDNPMLVQMVEHFIGGSKLMFLTTNPRLEKAVYILNEDLGLHKDGMWFSNSNGVYEPKPAKPVTERNFTDLGRGKLKALPGPTKLTQKKPGKPGFRMPEKLIKDPSSVGTERFIKARRLEKGLNNDISFFASLGEWLCMDCEMQVKVAEHDAGNCSCYELFCITCNNLPPQCLCPGNERALVAFTADSEFVEDNFEDLYNW